MQRLLLIVIVLCCVSSALAAEPSRPNVIVILADDLGYGDVQCYNPERGKIRTPHIDRLAAEGMRFTDAHTSSGVCSPTRYALLTGRYHWRSRLQSGIVGYLETPLIAPDRATIADLFRQHGYRTAMFGKWHLGWDWPISPEEKPLFAPPRGEPAPALTEAHLAAWRRVYSEPIGGGPLDCGFDEYFGTDVPNWPPYSFFENDRVAAMPDAWLPQDQLQGTLASLPGPAVMGWDLTAVLPAIADRACEFAERSSRQAAPYFMYLPLTSPHTPIAVAREWQNRSGLNAYADFVMQTDAVVGRVLETVERSAAADNTLVVFTSDNGCSPLAKFPELEAMGHYPSGPLRGQKADAWEGGHRVPFIVRWPGEVPADTRCDELVQQSDLYATFAAILGAEIPGNAAEDSFNLLPLWRGGDDPVREFAVSCASSGLPALRKSNWKIIFGTAGGGRGANARNRPQAQAESVGPPGQLYDLANDLGETINLWSDRHELVAELTADMQTLVENGRTTFGPQQPNDVPVRWRRFLNQQPE